MMQKLELYGDGGDNQVIITYQGERIQVHLLPGCLTIEFKPEIEYQGSVMFTPQGLYIIDYDEISKVLLSSKCVILVLKDGTRLQLDVDNCEGLYKRLVQILVSIGR